jgi:uncharacterized membrane protein YhdT
MEGAHSADFLASLRVAFADLSAELGLGRSSILLALLFIVLSHATILFIFGAFWGFSTRKLF